MNAWLDRLIDLGLTADAECWRTTVPEWLQLWQLYGKLPEMLEVNRPLGSHLAGSGSGYGSSRLGGGHGEGGCGKLNGCGYGDGALTTFSVMYGDGHGNGRGCAGDED